MQKYSSKILIRSKYSKKMISSINCKDKLIDLEKIEEICKI